MMIHNQGKIKRTHLKQGKDINNVSIKATSVGMQRGFALIATISIMVLLVTIGVAMLTLSTTELKSSASNSAINQARANARLALMEAIGQLQVAAGLDQRITATADVNGTTSEQPNLLGVWLADINNLTKDYNPDYDQQKEDDFVQWLASAPSNMQTSIGYRDQALDDTNSVALVDEGTVSDSDRYLRASTIDVNVDGFVGKYAWAVIDESQKVRITLKDPELSSSDEQVAALGLGGKPGFSIDSKYSTLESLTDEQREKLISLETSDLTTFDSLSNSGFSFLTSDSKSLLVNVVKGGFQKDLSLLFGDITLPNEYLDRHIYSDDADKTAIVSDPVRFDNADYIPNSDPKWSQLFSHYNLYKKINTGGAYGLTASDNKRGQAGDYFDEQQILPVVSNAQFIFSLSPEHSRGSYFMNLLVDHAITLWNPYNVELVVDEMEIELYRLPFNFQFFGNGGTLSAGRTSNYARMLTAFDGVKAGDFDDLPTRLRIPSNITFAPGEYKVFAAPTNTQAVSTFQARNYTDGIDLAEGLDTTIDNNSTRLIGVADNFSGIFTTSLTGNALRINLTAGMQYQVGITAGKLDGDTSIQETNNQEIATYLKVFRGAGLSERPGATTGAQLDEFTAQLELSERKHVGSIAIDYSDADLAELLPEIDFEDTPKYTAPADLTDLIGDDTEKVPFFAASLRLKTESDVDEQGNFSSVWLNNGIANPYFVSGITGDQELENRNHQYELKWDVVTSWSGTDGSVQIDPATNRGYGGSGITQGSGVTHLPFLQVPLAPATSIAQLSHAPINSNGLAPYTTQVIGNSFSSPALPLDVISEEESRGSYKSERLDHSYMANRTLFDGYFLSTATAEDGPLSSGASRDLSAVLDDFTSGNQSLPNNSFTTIESSLSHITTADYANFAQYLYNEGAFNVNSTSVEAWALFLASGTQESLPILEALTASSSLSTAGSSDDYAFSRFTPMLGDEVGAPTDAISPSRWAGHRRLTSDQITELAEEVVRQVQIRGPFQSIAEFVNRRSENDSITANSGALQSAIDSIGLNTNLGQPAPENQAELVGSGLGANTSDGAATQIMQSDLLNRLAPSITVRGDTFKVRAYGEATVKNNTVKVWCEAVVQRRHEFVDSGNSADEAFENLNDVNARLGRRFEIVSFRWLKNSEI